MGNKDTALFVAGIIFLIVTVLHVVRLGFQYDIVVGEWLIPMWVSYVGVVVFSLLSIWMFSCRTDRL